MAIDGYAKFVLVWTDHPVARVREYSHQQSIAPPNTETASKLKDGTRKEPAEKKKLKMTYDLWWNVHALLNKFFIFNATFIAAAAPLKNIFHLAPDFISIVVHFVVYGPRFFITTYDDRPMCVILFYYSWQEIQNILWEVRRKKKQSPW